MLFHLCFVDMLTRGLHLKQQILADKVGIRCKLVKRSHYTGIEDDAVSIIKLDNGRYTYLMLLLHKYFTFFQ
jgi:Ethylene-responsive protein kinase Le-CTR1